MEFTLLYDGPLKTNGTAKQKQEIRRVFHRQLKNLWQQLPLNGLQSKLLKKEPKNGETSILQKVGEFMFAPLISVKLCLTAELNITFLRPEAPGSLINYRGDIDNRLKTLFDSLRMAKVESEIPSGEEPKSDENHSTVF